MKKQTAVTFVLIGSVLIALSFGYGYWLKGTKTTSVEESIFAKLEKSQLVDSWRVIIGGQITEISGRTITLAYKGESLEILVKEDARVTRVILNESVGEDTPSALPVIAEREEIGFESLEIGDMVSVLADVKLTGELQGADIAVVPESFIE